MTAHPAHEVGKPLKPKNRGWNMSSWTKADEAVLRKFPGNPNAAFDALVFLSRPRSHDAVYQRMYKLGIHKTPKTISQERIVRAAEILGCSIAALEKEMEKIGFIVERAHEVGKEQG